MPDDIFGRLESIGMPMGEEPPIDEAPAFGIPADIDRRGEGVVPLGHDRGIYYYLSRSTGQVEPVPAAGHTRGMLAHLASEVYHWQRGRFATPKGVDWNAAADDMRISCRRVGIFDPERLRGRGAWLDNGRWVLHLGDHLVVDGEEAPLDLADSHHVYERARQMHIEIGKPLTTAQAKPLMDLCCAAPWEQPDMMGRMLAGWVVIAPVCGALQWRPHMWMTAEGGDGKSWIIDNIVKPLVGYIALQVQSKTSEAGIRQTLGRDARPVVFDEFESQNDADRARVQQVLDLARQASSAGGADIIKGGANGKATHYSIQSTFFFSSVNLSLAQAADESRIVVLALNNALTGDARVAAFQKLKALHAKVMQANFAPGLLARTLRLLPVIRQNAEMFAEAIARAGQGRRPGDTYGALLAGAWSLRSTSVATPQEADAFIAGQQWVQDAIQKSAVEPEWQRALSRLLQHRERVTGHNGSGQDIPIGELIGVCATGIGVGSIGAGDAKQALERMWMRLSTDDFGNKMLLVGNNSEAVKRAFDKTPWATGWRATLTRMPGAKRDAKPILFAGTQRTFGLPVSAMRVAQDD